MKYKSFMFFMIATIASGLMFAAEPNQLPKGLPPLTAKALVSVADEDQSSREWSISLTMRRENWKAIGGVIPKLNWPEPKKDNLYDATLTLPMGDDSKPVFCRVVDINGKELGGDQLAKKLKAKKLVHVSVSGKMPESYYLQVQPKAELIVLLGPGDSKGTEKKPDKKKDSKIRIKEEPEVDFKKWGEKESKKYYFGQMQSSQNYKISTVKEAAEYLHGIWRLDKKAHVGGGHYVHADQGDDVTVICTEKWLVKTLYNNKKKEMGFYESLDPIKKIVLAPDALLQVNDRRLFRPINDDHMVVVDYDFIAVVKRAEFVNEHPDRPVKK
ncbi:MAG: hypothetical protein K9M75_03320 [Phycisphaerae bacterium]|nr:hypothetical protein [Phycisphaerae bacterium]